MSEKTQNKKIIELEEDKEDTISLSRSLREEEELEQFPKKKLKADENDQQESENSKEGKIYEEVDTLKPMDLGDKTTRALKHFWTKEEVN